MLHVHFITGVTGFVGSHLTLRLLLEGAQVVAMVRATDNEAARARLVSILLSIDAQVELPLHNLYVFAGDVQDSTEDIVSIRPLLSNSVNRTFLRLRPSMSRDRDM